MKLSLKVAILGFACFFALQEIQGCTAFKLTAEDGGSLYCRSMEFGFTLDSNLLIVPKESKFTGTALNQKPGHIWTTVYGYVGMNQTIAPTLVSDGMNEKGLIVGALYLPGFAQFSSPNPEQSSQMMGPWEVASFFLGTCSNLKEVKESLDKVVVAEVPLPGMGDFVIPLHFYVTDSSGDVLIIEYVKGEKRFYDNPVGALTNSPPFDWQLINLSNFVNLSPTNVSPLNLSKIEIQNFSQGSGLLGIPGDYTAPSRFVRASLYSHWAIPQKNSQEAVSLGFHILNTFDIFEGIVRSKPNEQGKADLEKTEWIVVHDSKQLKTYFRGYNSLKIQGVDLKKIDFNQKGFKQIPIDKFFNFEDVTNKIQPLSTGQG